MLIFALVVSAVVYCVLYWFWSTAQNAPQNLVDVIHIVDSMFFVPGHIVFVIFRGLLLATALYIVTDFLISGVRNDFKRRPQEEPRKLHLKYIIPRK